MNTLVKPFAALRPTAAEAGAVVAPPYDVVSTAEAKALVAGHPHSFLHISRPEVDLPDGTDPHDERVYARARANLDRLIGAGILVRDAAPAYYVYRMRMGAHEQTGIAVTASVAAYEANRVRRHELTRPDKETDRVRNMASLDAQTGPVLCAYRADSDLERLLEAAKQNAAPIIDVTGPHDVVHTIWRIDDSASIDAVTAAFERLGAIYIADGHHRSAAAARVAAERRGKGGDGNDSFEYFLSVVFPHDQMRILDYNRVIGDLNGLTVEGLLAQLTPVFDVRASSAPVKPDTPATFGMYVDGRWFELRLDTALVPTSDPVASLDVSLLQATVIAPLLGIDDPRTDPRIDFVGGVRGLDELARRVDALGTGVAFAFYPTSMEQLMAVADAGKLMPPKSTWFEPKLADGLLAHVLD